MSPTKKEENIKLAELSFSKKLKNNPTNIVKKENLISLKNKFNDFFSFEGIAFI